MPSLANDTSRVFRLSRTTHCRSFCLIFSADAYWVFLLLPGFISMAIYQRGVCRLDGVRSACKLVVLNCVVARTTLLMLESLGEMGSLHCPFFRASLAFISRCLRNNHIPPLQSRSRWALSLSFRSIVSASA